MAVVQALTDNTYVFATETVRWIVVFWLFVLGAVLGSFMNVVVYRLPRGLNLSRPGSRCTACGHPIRWHDNVPIFGWLWLRGRCRDCHQPISARYPLVELLVGAMSALLGWAAIEPVMAPTADSQALFAFHFGQYAFRMLLMCALVSAAFMEYDGYRAPATMLIAIFAAGVLAGSLWPALRGGMSPDQDLWRGVYEGLAGAAVALALAALAWPGWAGGASAKQVARAGSSAALLLLVGAFLGPRDAALLAAYAMAWYAVVMLVRGVLGRSRRLSLRWAGIGWASCLALTVFSRMVARLPGSWQHDDASLLIAAAVAVGLFAITVSLARAAAGPEFDGFLQDQ
jgi:leader peptidase (prepilin peptidase)/N-methyltransferase